MFQSASPHNKGNPSNGSSHTLNSAQPFRTSTKRDLFIPEDLPHDKESNEAAMQMTKLLFRTETLDQNTASGFAPTTHSVVPSCISRATPTKETSGDENPKHSDCFLRDRTLASTGSISSWPRLLSWLPSAEELQAGCLFTTMYASGTTMNPEKKEPQEGKRGNRNPPESLARLLDTASKLPPLTEAEHPAGSDESSDLYEAATHTTGEQGRTRKVGRELLTEPSYGFSFGPHIDGKTSASCQEGDSENLAKWEMVKALREWVLMQPVHLGRPVAPDNPTFYSLYLNWSNSQEFTRRLDDEEEKDVPGRTSSVDGEALSNISPPPHPTKGKQGRTKKSPIHLPSMKLYEDGDWAHERINKRKVGDERLGGLEMLCKPPSSHDDLPTFAAKSKAMEKEEDVSRSEERCEDDDFPQSKRRRTLNAKKTLSDGEADGTPKPGTRARKASVRHSLDSARPNDDEQEKVVEMKKRRRESNEQSVSAERAEDPDFVPTKPKALEEPGRKQKRKSKKKDDKLRHLRPASVESCHRCKNRKEYWMGCPVVEAHRYCKGCVERHFNLNYEENSSKSAEIWKDGCPICNLTCQCAACRRKKEAVDAGLSPPAKRRRSDAGDEDYGGIGRAADDIGGIDGSSGRKTRSQTRSDSDESEQEKSAGKEAEVTRTHSFDDLKEGSDDEEMEDREALRRSGSRDSDRKSKATPRMQTRSRTKDSPSRPKKRDNKTADSAVQEFQTVSANGNTVSIRKENGYYVLDNTDDVEAFVGLTGAGSVLSRRYPTPTMAKVAPYVKQYGKKDDGW